MGNSLSGPKHVKLGSHAAIDMTREKPERGDGGGYSQGWTVSYTSHDESSCTLYLEKLVDQRGRVGEVFLDLEDDICFGSGMRMWIRRAQTDFLYIRYEWSKRFQDMMMSFKKNYQSSNPPGGVTLLHVFCYGRGSKVGLVVVEGKKKSRDDINLCTATVAHYYAIGGGPDKIDIGVSTMVNIRGSNNNLDFAVEGPDRYPPSALYYVFELVSRSGSWSRPYAQTRRQCGGFSEQSEADSDDDSETSSDGSDQTDSDGSETESDGRSMHNNKNINGDGNGNVNKGRQKFVKKLNIYLPEA